MPLPQTLSAETLLRAYNEAPLTPDVLVKAVLCGALVSDKGAKVAWPAPHTLTIGNLFSLRVSREEWNGGAPVQVKHALGVLIARRAQQLLQRAQKTQLVGFPLTQEQSREFPTLAQKVFEPIWDVPVSSMLRFAPDDDTGFFQWSFPTELFAIEKSIVTEMEPLPDAQGWTRLVWRQPVAGMELSIWRARFANPDMTNESVWGCVAVLTDQNQQLAAYLIARCVFLPQDMDETELMWALGNYDPLGLELGHALRAQVVSESMKLDDLLDGGGLMQLCSMEVREDLRSTQPSDKLGKALLLSAVPAMAQGLTEPVTKLATAVQPFQYAYPVDIRLPASFVLEALDAVDRVKAHLDDIRPQDLVAEMVGTEVIHLATDPRARGSSQEQAALCEAVAHGEE